MLPSLQRKEIGTSELDPFRSSILGPWSPLWTLHGCPREQKLVHHSGSGWLARPSPWGTCTSYSLPASWRTPRWVNRVIWLSAGYFRSSPGSGCRNGRSSCLKGANRRHRACTPLDSFLSEDLVFTRKGQSEHDFSCWRPLRPPLDAVLAHVADE